MPSGSQEDVSDPSQMKKRLRQFQVCVAWTSPPIDAFLACLYWLLTRSDLEAAFGWTVHAPLGFVAVRLVWMLLALVCALMTSSSDSHWKKVREISELLFPYCSYGALGVVGLAHVIVDPPHDEVDADETLFWVATLTGVLCITGQTWCTLPGLEDVQQWRLARISSVRASVSSGQDVELLAGSEVTTTSAPTAAGSSPLSAGDENKNGAAKKLLHLAVYDWHLFIQAAILLALAAIAEVLIPHYTGEAISIMIKAEEDGTLARKPFKPAVVKLVISAVACGLLSSCRGATFICIGGRASARLRQSLFHNLLKQDIGFYDTTKTGELTSRMTQDCQKVTDQITLNVNVFLRTLVSMITTLFFMYSLAPSLMLVSFVSIPIIAVLSKKYGLIMQKISKDTQKTLADANAVAEEDLSSMATVRMFAAEWLELDRFGHKLTAFKMLQYKRAAYYIGYLALVVALPQLVTALVVFYGGRLAVTGEIQASILLSFVFYLQTLNSNFSQLGDFYTAIMDAMGSAARVFELQEREPALPLDPPSGQGAILPYVDSSSHIYNLGTVRGHLELKDIHFTYPARPEVTVLKGLSLSVPAGNVVALVGPSGNGKSTVIGLLTRLYKAEKGSVTLDGTDVWDFQHSAYHQAVSIVGQEPVLYSRTIRENIVYGLQNPGDPAVLEESKVVDSCKTANAHDFISNMPEGYETNVGERGVTLSGGQKQRIAIARAMAREPRVLLLDEATSALDTESEKQVQEAIDNMIASGRMTVVIIAHRLSTVKNSNKICVIKGGEVVEEGRHEALISNKGVYFQLVESQLHCTQTEEAGTGEVQETCAEPSVSAANET